MLLAKLMLCMNEELRLAHVQEVQAAIAAKACDPQRVGFYTSNATPHLDRHDVMLQLVNSILLGIYDTKMNDYVPTFPDAPNAQPSAVYIENLEREWGPLPTTVRERVRYYNMESTARRDMLSNGAYALRFKLRASMQNDSIYHATVGVQTAVLE